ncbi:MAG: lipid kinase [Pseudanabaena sp.]|nr:MAG: lipid kinase [Pseudanabaena sp.]
MQSQSISLIFNPVAGQGNPEQDLAMIRSILEPAIALDVQMTTPDISAAELAKKAVEMGATAVIASGGDGTISAVADALIGKNIPLGIISRGTANGFANALGLPIAIAPACESILAGHTRIVDAAICNGLPMLLLAGIGFEAETVKNAGREAKNWLGVLAYIAAGIEQLGKMKQFDAEIETEDKIITVTAAALTIANAAPPTSILAQGVAGVIFDDGLLDLTIVSTKSKATAIAASFELLTSALSGEAVNNPDIGYLRAKSFKIKTDPPQNVVLDGEIIGATPIEVECIPNGLVIFAPQTEPTQPEEKLEGLPNLTITLKNSN